MATATKARRKNLTKAQPTALPTLAKDGLSADAFLRAVTNARDGLVRLTLGPNVQTIKCPEMVTLTSEGRPDEPLSLAIVGAYLPMVNLGLRQGVYGEPVQWAVAVVVPLALGGEIAQQINTPSGSRVLVGSPYQRPASADDVRVTIAKLADRGASLLLHAGDSITGFWLLDRPLSRDEARLLSAKLANSIEGAVKIAVSSAQRPMSGPIGGFGLERAWIPAEQDLLYHFPLAAPAANIVPRQEWVVVGDVTSRVAPESL